MKMSLLELTQDILNDLDSDDVNSIDDTIESQQVAQIIKTTFMAMMSNRNWPHLRRTVQTLNSGVTTRPTHLSLKDNVKELICINYDTRESGETKKNYVEMKYLEPDAFLRKSNVLNSDSDNVVTVIDNTGVEFFVRSDKGPEYYTSFDDENLVFDSYDSTVSTTLLSSRVQALAYIMPEWEQLDTHIPDLPEEAFVALLEEAKSRAFIKLKQSIDNSADLEAARQKRWLSRKAWKVDGGLKYPNYGRVR